MLDDEHLALLPPPVIRDELRALVEQEPRISQLAHAGPGRAEPTAIVSLENDAGDVVFQMVELPIPGVPGRLFVGPMPGRVSALASELDALVAFGIRHVFCLVPRIDLAEPYRVPTYVEEASARFDARLHLIDVVDYEVPPDDAAFEAAVAEAERAVEAGEKVYVHCGVGCGRAGVFVSCMLVWRGMEAFEAIGRYRAIRGCGPETPDQVAYVVRFAQRWRRGEGGSDGG